MGKSKFKFISPDEFNRWIGPSNLIAKSLLTGKEALSQFNQLTSEQRTAISKEFSSCDEIRRKQLSKCEKDDRTWEICTMVDAHIIATEYDIDPLCAVMCIKPPCRSDQKVKVK